MGLGLYEHMYSLPSYEESGEGGWNALCISQDSLPVNSLVPVWTVSFTFTHLGRIQVGARFFTFTLTSVEQGF